MVKRVILRPTVSATFAARPEAASFVISFGLARCVNFRLAY
jgi:hypothetical protein